MSRLDNLARRTNEQIAFPFPEDFTGLTRENVALPPAVKMDTGDITARIHRALRQAFDGVDSPVKRIARIANSNVRAAENWWQGKNSPGAVHLLRLAAQVPELKAEVRRLLGLTADLDPELEQAAMELMRQFSKRMGR